MVETVAAGEISSDYREVVVYGVLLVYLLGRDLTGDDGLIKRLRMARATGAKSSYEKSRVHGLGSKVAKLVPAADVAAAGRGRFTLRWTEVIPVVALGLIALTPFVLASNGNAMSSATLIVLSAIGAIGLGLVMGLAGQFSLGQAAFYLLSGYAVAIHTKHAWAPLPALAMGTALAIVGGLLIGWLTLRLKGFNLAIATLAINLIMLVVVVQPSRPSGGPLGLIGVPPLTILGVDLSGPRPSSGRRSSCSR